MTDDAPLTPSQEDQALAAELALGLLDGPEAAAATARMSTDPDFARIVHDWYERMAGIAEALVARGVRRIVMMTGDRRPVGPRRAGQASVAVVAGQLAGALEGARDRAGAAAARRRVRRSW